MYNRQRLRTYLGFDDTLFILVGIPLVAFLIPLLFFRATLENGLIAYLPKWGTSLMYTSVYWFSARAVFIFMRKRYPNYGDTSRRIIYTVLGVLITFFCFGSLLDYVYHKNAGSDDNGIRIFDYHVASLTILLLCSTIYESIFLYARWRRTMIETEQLKREHIQSQLEGLKSQVNPHFLFNSLNTLVYIIPEDPDKAIKFVQKLSKVYRYVLEIRDKKLISLSEELGFLNAYTFLLKERFGESLHIELEITPGMEETKIVPLSLQILFENAIKHNIISSQKPLTIRVGTEGDGRLIVQNNLQVKRQRMPSTKVGLENIKSRYAFFSNERVIVESTPTFFTVSLPLLNFNAAEPTFPIS